MAEINMYATYKVIVSVAKSLVWMTCLDSPFNIKRLLESEIFEKNLFYLAFEGKIWVSEAFTNVRTTGLFTNEVCNWAL